MILYLRERSLLTAGGGSANKGGGQNFECKEKEGAKFQCKPLEGGKISVREF